MKLFNEVWIPRLIIIFPLLILVTVSALIVYFYTARFNYYFEEESRRYLQEFINVEQKQGEEFVQDLDLLLEYKYNHIEEEIRASLKERVNIAYESANYIYETYAAEHSSEEIQQRIKDALHKMVWHNEKNFIWITDYEGNNILSGNQKIDGLNIWDYSDADGRLIIQEEIDLVQREEEGFLRSRFAPQQSEQIMYVRGLGEYNWFFGTGIHIEDTKTALQTSMINMLHEMPTDKTAFIAIYNAEGPILISEGAQEYIHDENSRLIQNALKKVPLWQKFPSQNAMIYSQYFEPFGWYLLYGFDTRHFKDALQVEINQLSINIESEIIKILAVSLIIVLIVGLFSLMLSRRINSIFNRYKEEVYLREEVLRELNATLERRVSEEVQQHREKENMLIQQSKMAAMGDMISMIAHQWRQPLNQLSFVLMNIEGAHESKELSDKYLKEKVNEGTELLEFMSHTIDDFRNFFRPDKARQESVISEVVEQTLPLIAKSLEHSHIILQTLLDCNTSVLIYRNELMQVILNIVHNAKDALEHVENPRIMLESYETGQFVVIKICDNAGGIDDEVAKKMFEPYFTTKGESGGSGLGLYMSKTIMEKHLNGELRFENSAEGACFFIKIGKYQF